MLIAQISDLHIRPAGEKLYDFIDTNAMCARHVAMINNLPERPDAVIVTGDIANCGTASEYRMAARILGQLSMPVYAIPGNHDNKYGFVEGLSTLFPRIGTDPENICFTVDEFPIRLAFIDSSIPGKLHGRVTDRTLEWLDYTLGERPDQETVVFMHHHPVPSGCRHMDGIRCLNGHELIDVLRQHTQVTRLFCGHTHRTIVQSVGGLLVMTAPSACHQVPYDTQDPDGFYSLEPPAMLMHRFDPGTGLVTHVASLATFDGPFRFDAALGCPDAGTLKG